MFSLKPQNAKRSKEELLGAYLKHKLTGSDFYIFDKHLATHLESIQKPDYLKERYQVQSLYVAIAVSNVTIASDIFCLLSRFLARVGCDRNLPEVKELEDKVANSDVYQYWQSFVREGRSVIDQLDGLDAAQRLGALLCLAAHMVSLEKLRERVDQANDEYENDCWYKEEIPNLVPSISSLDVQPFLEASLESAAFNELQAELHSIFND